MGYRPAVSRTRLVNMSLGLVALFGAIGVYAWYQAEEETARDARRAASDARQEERQARDEERMSGLIEESRELMPSPLQGLALGMARDGVTELRTAITPKAGSNDPDKTFYEERLPNGSQIVYGFDKETDSLAQIQVLSVLPSAGALTAHFTAMVDEYGRPSGAWDCPDTGGVPTRRFTWRRARTTLADIFLVYGNRISVTLYIAPTEVIGRSLQRARCRPVESHEQLLTFPTTTLDAIQESQRSE